MENGGNITTAPAQIQPEFRCEQGLVERRGQDIAEVRTLDFEIRVCGADGSAGEGNATPGITAVSSVGLRYVAVRAHRSLRRRARRYGGQVGVGGSNTGRRFGETR